MSGVAGRYGGVPEDVPMQEVTPKAPKRRGRKAETAAVSALKHTPAPPTQPKKRQVRKKEAKELEHIFTPVASKSKKVAQKGDVSAGTGRSLRARMESVATTTISSLA